MTRLFIALPIGGEIRSALQPVHAYLLGYEGLIKTVAPENYHITVKFLGECEGNTAKAIESTFPEIAAPQGEIPFTLKGLGAFPDIRKPSVLWTGLITDSEKISLLHKNVARFAANFKFKEEKREYSPHLTIARVRSGRKITGDLLKFLEKNRETSYGESSFKRLSLFASKLTPEGPVYTELKSISF
jgi:2'-5' RNA ligase